jgi:hypothetical protein
MESFGRKPGHRTYRETWSDPSCHGLALRHERNRRTGKSARAANKTLPKWLQNVRHIQRKKQRLVNQGFCQSRPEVKSGSLSRVQV